MILIIVISGTRVLKWGLSGSLFLGRWSQIKWNVSTSIAKKKHSRAKNNNCNDQHILTVIMKASSEKSIV